MNAQPNITSLLCNPPPTQPMNDVMPFDFEGAQGRTVNIGGELYFVGMDVAERLGYANPSKAMSDHCKGITNRYPLKTAGGEPDLRKVSRTSMVNYFVSRLVAGFRLFFDAVNSSLFRCRRGCHSAPQIHDPAGDSHPAAEGIPSGVKTFGRWYCTTRWDTTRGLCP